jgi:hypothetical protein
MYNLRRAEKILAALRTRWGKRAQVDYRVLCRTLNREFKGLHMKFFFRARPYESFKNNHTWFVEGNFTRKVPGVYIDDPLYEIRIVRRVNRKFFTVNKWFWDELYLVIAHELRHGYQYRRRKGKMVYRTERPDLNPKADKYLCDFDELDAHAYEAALEWKLKGGDVMKLFPVKKYYTKCRRKAMPEWRRFIKKVHKYYHQT